MFTPMDISIHAPIVGCDGYCFNDDKGLYISIHAPIVGCDRTSHWLVDHHYNFNPRTHRGVRLYTHVTASRFLYFNPRTHRGVRLLPQKALCRTCNDFNPRTHRGVRLESSYSTLNVGLISIHAPIVGCDRANFA